MAKKEEKCCTGKKHKGAKMLIIGVLVLLNSYLALMGWDYFIGGILALLGLYKLLSGPCCCKK